MSKKVFVGMSGGVDSSVSAYLLKKEGYEVTGVFIKVWQPDFVPCTWREDRLDAMRVCASLKIPFITLDLEKEYKAGVIDYMLAEYKAGRTPNPDVFCNKEVKFGAFLNWVLKERVDYIATGHYARIENGKLLKGTDGAKDQSYFLWTLKEEQLQHILFPVGGMEKREVRNIAKKANLITADKKDSQGLCFISNVNMKQFLKHFLPDQKGNILNEKGEIIGNHEGAIFYTIGERHGFTITKKSSSDSPYYVVSKDVSNNTITVSSVAQENSGTKKEFEIRDISLISESSQLGKTVETKCQAQVRYHGELLPCTLTIEEPASKVVFEKQILISSGQSIVFYDGEVCLGGAIID